MFVVLGVRRLSGSSAQGRTGISKVEAAWRAEEIFSAFCGVALIRSAALDGIDGRCKRIMKALVKWTEFQPDPGLSMGRFRQAPVQKPPYVFEPPIVVNGFEPQGLLHEPARLIALIKAGICLALNPKLL